MKNVKQAVSVIFGASVVFFSPGFACYQAMAGAVDVRAEAGADVSPAMDIGSAILPENDLGVMTANGIGPIEGLNLAAPDLPTAQAASQEVKMAEPSQPKIAAPENASRALSARANPSANVQERESLGKKIAAVATALKAMVKGVQSAASRRQDVSGQYEAGKTMFDLAGKTEGTMPAAPGVVGSLGGFVSLTHSAASGQSETAAAPAVPQPKPSDYPEPISWRQKMAKSLGLGGIREFTKFEAGILPETSVLFTPFVHDGDPYYYDRFIAQMVLNRDDFNSYLDLSGRNYIELRAVDAQEAMNMALFLNNMPQVWEVAVSRTVVGLVKAQLPQQRSR